MKQAQTSDPAVLTAHLMEALQLAEETLRAEASRLYTPAERGRGMLTHAADLIAMHYREMATGPELLTAQKQAAGALAALRNNSAERHIRECAETWFYRARAVINKAEGKS